MITEFTNSAYEDRLTELLRKYYIDEIDALALNSTFRVDITKDGISDIFYELGDEFITVLKRSTIRLFKEKHGNKSMKFFQKLNFSLISNEILDISQLNSEHLNTNVFIKTQVLDISLPQGYTSEAAYVCSECGDIIRIEMKPSSFIYKFIRCKNEDCKGKMFFDQNESKKDRAQRITLQDIRIENPRYLKADLKNDLVEKIAPGDKLKICGMYIAPRISEETNRGDLILDITSFEPLEEDKDIELSQEKINFYKDLSITDEDKYKKQLISSFAKHIVQRDLEKWAILLNLVSAPDLLEPYRSTTNLLLVGNPGTGKSELLKEVKKVVKRSAYADGTAMTGKGLIFTLDTIGNQRILRAGILIQNNYGHVCLDEFDKSKTEDRQALNQTLEQQMATYHKAGFNASRECKISLIAAANPHNLRWNESPDMTIMDNLKPIEDTTVSRFDVIILLKNIPNRELDRIKAKHILDTMRGKITAIDNDELAGIIAYCKRLNPQFTKEAEQILEDFFVKIRNSEYTDKSLVLGERQYLGIIRLAKCWAKLLFRIEISAQIVKDTIKFYFQTLETLGLQIMDGQHQIPLQNIDMNKEEIIFHTINSCLDENKTFSDRELIDKLVEKGFTMIKALQAIQKYKNAGKLLEQKNGRYMLI